MEDTYKNSTHSKTCLSVVSSVVFEFVDTSK